MRYSIIITKVVLCMCWLLHIGNTVSLAQTKQAMEPSDKSNIDPLCDPETGVCEPGEAKKETTKAATIEKSEGIIIYVGDPMCSWCWGISEDLGKVRQHFKDTLDFKLIVGGLRPGGGDPWNEQFKSFLRHHWEEVHERSGQPFGYSLFERESFNYDTEPSCRAVVIVRAIAPEQEYTFFKKVQKRFYVDNEDPNEVVFYKPICEELNIPYDAFQILFTTDRYRQMTIDDFKLSQSLGVRGFPTVLLQVDDRVYSIARGYADEEILKNRIHHVLSTAAVAQE